MIHPTSDVKSQDIGNNTSIWQFVVVMEGAKLGANCNVGSHTFIEGKVIIGDQVTIKNGVLIFDGVVIEDDCFIKPTTRCLLLLAEVSAKKVNQPDLRDWTLSIVSEFSEKCGKSAEINCSNCKLRS